MPNDKQHESSPAQMEMENANKALRLAIKRGQVDTVIDLLKRGACPNERDNNGSSPLHLACSLDEISEQKAEAGTDDEGGGADDEDRTISIIQALLAHGAEIDQLDKEYERTPHGSGVVEFKTG